MNLKEHCLDTSSEIALAWLYQAKYPCWVLGFPFLPMEVALLVQVESLLHIAYKGREFRRKCWINPEECQIKEQLAFHVFFSPGSYSQDGLCFLLSHVQLFETNIQKTKIVASGPITSWEIDGETVETMADFIFLGSKVTADGDCSHEIKRRLLLERKVKTNLDSIFKSRDITLPTKVCLVKAMVFQVVMYGLWELEYEEGWAPKNWCFWTVVLEKTLESPLDCKEI